MLTQDDVMRERYESRRKAQLDYNTGLRVARQEGQEEGREEGRLQGEKIGAIHLCERLLNLSVTPTENLKVLSLDDLTRLEDELQAKLGKRP